MSHNRVISQFYLWRLSPSTSFDVPLANTLCADSPAFRCRVTLLVTHTHGHIFLLKHKPYKETSNLAHVSCSLVPPHSGPFLSSVLSKLFC